MIPKNNYKDNLAWLTYAEEADDYATVNELTVLSNLETHNAQMIREGKDKNERFSILKEIAKYQLGILDAAEQIKVDERTKCP